MTYKTKLSTGIATGALLLASFAPAAFADVNTDISGNGANSNNTINITQNNTVSVSQSNTAIMGNFVYGSANTGGNKASQNTGGDVMVTTGNATVNATASNTNGGNIANVPSISPVDVTANVTGNGNNSTNKNKVTNSSKVKASQSSLCVAGNIVVKKAKTGKNKANKNTKGTVNVTSGDAQATADVSNDCGFNVLNPSVE